MSIRPQDQAYIQALREASSRELTSEQIQALVNRVNSEGTGRGIYTADALLNLVSFYRIATVRTQLGQPRHGSIANSGRLHQVRF